MNFDLLTSLINYTNPKFFSNKIWCVTLSKAQNKKEIG